MRSHPRSRSRDPEALTEALADDVVFRSPVVFKAYEGKPVVSAILTEGAMKVFDDFRYVERFEDGDAAALIFKARVGDREVDGLDLLRFDGERQGGGADGDGAADERAQRSLRGDGPRVRAGRDRAAGRPLSVPASPDSIRRKLRELGRGM